MTKRTPTVPSTRRQVSSALTSYADVWAALRDEREARRAARAARRQLERELASYSTHAQRMELDAIIDRHDAEDAAYVRSLLDRRVA